MIEFGVCGGWCTREANPRPTSVLLGFRAGAESAGLRFAVALEEKGIVRNSFLDELFEEEEFGTIHYRMNALLEGLHGSERLERFAKQNNGSVASLVHRHLLEGLQSEIFGDIIGRKAFLDNNDVVVDLAEAD